MKRLDMFQRIIFGKGYNDYEVVQGFVGSDYIHYKDIIGGAVGVSQYSPDTCAFIDSSLNKFLCIRSNARGLYPVGATIDRKSGMFISRCMVGGGKRVSLGYFKTPEEAHQAWQQAKLDYGRELQSEQTDQRVLDGLDVILNRLEQDILEGNITERLV